MPIYEYRCLECGSVFEKIVPMNASSVACQKCESPRVEKLLSTFAVAVHGNHPATHEKVPGPCGSCGAAQEGMCRMMD